MLPYSTLGWLFVLIMSIVTLGSFLVLYAAYKFMSSRSPREELIVHIYSSPVGARVTVDANNMEWLETYLDWLKDTFEVVDTQTMEATS